MVNDVSSLLRPESVAVIGASATRVSQGNMVICRNCDTAAHRPRHFATPGSGWEQFLQFGNTLSQDKIMVGLSRGLMKMSYESLIAEYENLPLKETVIEKWLYHNAARFFRRD